MGLCWLQCLLSKRIHMTQPCDLGVTWVLGLFFLVFPLESILLVGLLLDLRMLRGPVEGFL